MQKLARSKRLVCNKINYNIWPDYPSVPRFLKNPLKYYYNINLKKNNKI